MTVADALPDRPLTPAEVRRLDSAESVEYAVVRGEFGPPERVVTLEVGVGSERVMLGYGPDPTDPDGEWVVLERLTGD